MPDLHSRIATEIDRRLAVARAASQNDHGSTPTGERWQWECAHCDTPVFITPVVMLDELLECPNPDCDSGYVDLRSIEQYPTASVGPLPHLVTYGISEMRPVDALHLQLNDPADSIRRLEAASRVLNRHAPTEADEDGERRCSGCAHDNNSAWPCWRSYPCPELLDLAASLGLDTEGSTTDG